MLTTEYGHFVYSKRKRVTSVIVIIVLDLYVFQPKSRHMY